MKGKKVQSRDDLKAGKKHFLSGKEVDFRLKGTYGASQRSIFIEKWEGRR